MRRLFSAIAFLFVNVLIHHPLQAQTCNEFATSALEAITTNCTSVANNSACYAYNRLETTFTDPTFSTQFDTPADQINLSSLQTIRSQAFNPTTNEWGIAVLKVQANIPNSLPGQAVTLIIAGDAEMTLNNAPTASSQAFIIRTGLGGLTCEDVPPSSLTIQSPQGMVVDLNVNGANIRVGSTAVIQTTEDQQMRIITTDGRVAIQGGRIVPTGFSSQIQLDDEGYVATDATWSEIEILSEEDVELITELENLPEDVLLYEIDVPNQTELEFIETLPESMLFIMDSYTLLDIAELWAEESFDSTLIAGLATNDTVEEIYTWVNTVNPELAGLFYDNYLSAEDLFFAYEEDSEAFFEGYYEAYGFSDEDFIDYAEEYGLEYDESLLEEDDFEGEILEEDTLPDEDEIIDTPVDEEFSSEGGEEGE